MASLRKVFSSVNFKTSIFVVWAVLVVLLLQRDIFVSDVSLSEQQVLDQAEREEYQGIYFRDQKIGYVINHYLPQGENSYSVDQRAHMKLNVGETIHVIDLQLQADMSAENHLQSFIFSFSSPFYRMTAEGEVEGNQINFTLNTGNNTITNSLALEGLPMVPTVRRGYLLKPDLEPGDKVKVPWFDPVSLTAKNSIIEYRGKERIYIDGRVHNLHKFMENIGGARVSFWLNEDGDVMKEQSPAGFFFIKEPKYRALKMAETSDELLSAVAVKITGVMPDLKNINIMKYRLLLPENAQFDIDGGRQSYKDQVLTLKLEQVPQEWNGVSTPQCADVDDSLDATPYIQSDSAKITELAERITAGTDSSVAKIRRIAEWVYANLEKRPVLGIPDALTTLNNLRGDCNEHAALFAALARSAGIPTRISAGVVFHKGAFYYHAWNEVCGGENWVSIDTTTNQFPADLSHLRFIQGGMNEQMRIGSLLGRLEIEPLSGEGYVELKSSQVKKNR